MLLSKATPLLQRDRSHRPIYFVSPGFSLVGYRQSTYLFKQVFTPINMDVNTYVFSRIKIKPVIQIRSKIDINKI